MNQIINDFVNSKDFLELTKNIKIIGIYLGGSRCYGVNSSYSDYDLVILNNSFDREWWFSVKKEGRKIDLFFIPDLKTELKSKVFELVKLYTLLNPDTSFILKDFDYDKEWIKEKLIVLIKKYFLNYLKNTEEIEYKKLDYHLCMVNMLLNGKEIDVENILNLKNTRKRNIWLRHQFQELLKLVEGN